MSMKARHISRRHIPAAGENPRPVAAGDTHALDLIPLLASSPDGIVDVIDGERTLASVTPHSLLKSLALIFPRVEDSSLVEVSCTPENYSASEISRAVEDSDARLLGLWTRIDAEGRLRAIIRVGRRDPRAAVRSLERYGYETTYMDSSASMDELTDERLAALRLYLGIGQHSPQ